MDPIATRSVRFSGIEYQNPWSTENVGMAGTTRAARLRALRLP